MALIFIVGIGVSFYIVSTKMIRDIYASSLSADRNLMNALGLVSFNSISWNDIQSRIDEQISRYSNSLNSKVRILSSLKNTLKSVNDFHKTIYSVQSVFDEMKNSMSISYFYYNSQNSTSLELGEFMTKNDAKNIMKKEKSFFESIGYNVSFTENVRSQWYKTVNRTLYLWSEKK